jgi:hypothetical protein
VVLNLPFVIYLRVRVEFWFYCIILYTVTPTPLYLFKLQSTPQSTIFVATINIDFRKGIDGFIAVCNQKVKQMTLDQIAKKGMVDQFEEIVVPVIEVSEIKRGQQVITEEFLIPGYILIKI